MKNSFEIKNVIDQHGKNVFEGMCRINVMTVTKRYIAMIADYSKNPRKNVYLVIIDCVNKREAEPYVAKKLSLSEYSFNEIIHLTYLEDCKSTYFFFDAIKQSMEHDSEPEKITLFYKVNNCKELNDPEQNSAFNILYDQNITMFGLNRDGNKLAFLFTEKTGKMKLYHIIDGELIKKTTDNKVVEYPQIPLMGVVF